MAQEYLSLDEAARELGMAKDELVRKAQRREIRAFADRGTWKFRKQDIEEHARQMGIGSGAEIVFGGLDADLPDLDSSDQILLSEQALDAGPGGSGARVIGMDPKGRTPSDSDVRLVPEAPGKGSDSDVKLVGSMKSPSDSDVRLVPETPGGGSDSDVKLVGGKKSPSDSDVKVVGAEKSSDSDVKVIAPPPASGSGRRPVKALSDSDVRLEAVKPPSDSDVKLGGVKAPSDSDIRLDVKAPSDSEIQLSPDLPATLDTSEVDVLKLSSDDELTAGTGSSGEQPIALDADSDFELSVGVAPKQGAAGDSDITLALDDEIGLASSDEIQALAKPPGASDVTAQSPSSSGINLVSPADSGIALERGAKPAARSGLGLGKTEGPGRSSAGRSAAGKSGPKLVETDFEIPLAADSDEVSVGPSSGDTAELGTDSDFELGGSALRGALDDSSSQVLSLEGEDGVDESAATSLGPAVVEDEWEEEGEGQPEFAQVSEVISGPLDEHEPVPDDETSVAATGTPLVTLGAPAAEWGGLWVGILSFSAVVMIMLGLVMIDLVRTMWGWDDQGSMFYKSPILNWMASLWFK
jgi:excisionase family DNA binding protein